MVIDTLQIKYFLAVAKYLNFTKAANELFVSQPAISRKVAALEKDLGIELIDRSKRNLQLTKEGEEFYLFFLKFDQQLNEIIQRNKSQDKHNQEELNIGIFEGWDISDFLLDVVSRMKLKYKNTVIKIETGREAYLVQNLKIHKFDAIIVLRVTIDYAIQSEKIEHVIVHDIMEVNQCVLYSENNKLAQKENLTLVDFKDQTLYGFKNKLMPLSIITNENLYKTYGFYPKVQLLGSLDSAINAISTGDGYAIVDELIRVKNNKGFLSFQLDQLHRVSLVMMKEGKKMPKEMISECIKDYIIEGNM